MGYNKRQFTKANDKKVLHKVRKHWVVVSMALLMAIGGKAAASHVSAHADTANNNANLTNRISNNISQSKNTLTSAKANNNNNANRANANKVNVSANANNISKQANVLHQRILQNANLNQSRNSQQGRSANAQANTPKVNNHVNFKANQNNKLAQNLMANSNDDKSASSVNQQANQVDATNLSSIQNTKLGAVAEDNNTPQTGDVNEGDGITGHINFQFLDESDTGGGLQAGSPESDEGYGGTPFNRSTLDSHLNDVPAGYDLINSSNHQVIKRDATIDQKMAAIMGSIPTTYTDGTQTIDIAVQKHKTPQPGQILVRYLNEDDNDAEVDQTPIPGDGNSAFNQASQYEHNVPSGYVFDKVLGYGNTTNGVTPTKIPNGQNVVWNIGVYMSNPASSYDSVKIQYQDHSDNDAVVGEQNFSGPSGTQIDYANRFDQYLPTGYDYDEADSGAVNNDTTLNSTDNGNTEVIYVKKNNVTPTPLSPLKGRSNINIYQVSDPNGEGNGTHVIGVYHLTGQTGSSVDLAHYKSTPPFGYKQETDRGNTVADAGQQLDNGVEVDGNETSNISLTYGKDFNGQDANPINIAYEFVPTHQHQNTNPVNYQVVYKNVQNSDVVKTLNVKGVPGSKIDYSQYTQFLPDDPEGHNAYTFAGMGSYSGVVGAGDQNVIYVNPVSTNTQGINVNYINKSSGQTVGTKNFAAGNYGSDVNVASDVPNGFTKVSGQQSDYAYNNATQNINYMVTGNSINDANAKSFTVKQKEYGHDGNYMSGHDQQKAFKIGGNIGDLITINPDGTIYRNGNKDTTLSSQFTYPNGFSTKNGDQPDTLEIGLNGALVNKTNNLSSGTTPNNNTTFDYSAQSNVGIPTNITAKFINQHGVQVGSSNVVRPMNSADTQVSDGRYGQSVDVAKNHDGYGAADSAIPKGYSLLSGENTTYQFNSDQNRTVNVYVNGNQATPKPNPNDPQGKTDTLQVNINVQGSQNGTPYNNTYQKYVQVPGSTGDTYVARASDYQPSGYNPNHSTQNVKIGADGELTPNQVTFHYNATDQQNHVAPIYLTYKDQQNGQVVGTPNMKITGNYNQTIDVTSQDPVPNHYTLTPHESTNYTFTDNPQNVTVYVQGAAQPSPQDANGNVVNVNYTLYNRHGKIAGPNGQVHKTYAITGHHVADSIAIDPSKVASIEVPDFHLKSGQTVKDAVVNANGDVSVGDQVSNPTVNYDLQENTGTVGIQYLNMDNGNSSVESDEATGDVQSDFTTQSLPSFESNRIPNGYNYNRIVSNGDANYRNGKTIQIGLNQSATMNVKYVDKKTGKLVSTKSISGNENSSINTTDLMNRLPGEGAYTLSNKQNMMDPANYNYTGGMGLPTSLKNSTFTIYLQKQNVTPAPVPSNPTNDGTINVIYFNKNDNKEVSHVTLHGPNSSSFNYMTYESNMSPYIPHNYNYAGPDSNPVGAYQSIYGTTPDGVHTTAGAMYVSFDKGVNENMIVDVTPGANPNSDVTDTIQYENYDPSQPDAHSDGQLVGNPISVTMPGNAQLPYGSDYNQYLPSGYEFVKDASGDSSTPIDTAQTGHKEVIYVQKDKQGNSLDPLTVEYYYNGSPLTDESIKTHKETGTPIDIGSYETNAPAGYHAVSVRSGQNINYYSNDPTKQEIAINVEQNSPVYNYGHIHVEYVNGSGNPVPDGDLVINGKYGSLVDLLPFERNTPQGWTYNNIEQGSNLTTWDYGSNDEDNMPVVKILVNQQ